MKNNEAIRTHFYTFHDSFSMLSWHVENFNWLDDFNKDKSKTNIDQIWIMSSLSIRELGPRFCV